MAPESKSALSTDHWISNGLDKREQSLRRCGVGAVCLPVHHCCLTVATVSLTATTGGTTGSVLMQDPTGNETVSRTGTNGTGSNGQFSLGCNSCNISEGL